MGGLARPGAFQRGDGGLGGDEAVHVGILHVAVFVLLRGKDDDVVDIPALYVSAMAGKIQAELRLTGLPFLHVEEQQVLALDDGTQQGVFPDAFPIFAVL